MKSFLIALFLALLLSLGMAEAQTISAKPEPRHSVEIKTITPVKVDVSGIPTPRPRDFIALYPLGATAYIDWFYIHGDKLKPAKGSAAGSATFMAPKPGQYEAKVWALTDAGVATLLKSVQVSVVLTPIEINGVELTVTRKPDSTTDELFLVIQGGKGQLSASQGTPVTVDAKVISPGP